MGLFGDLLHSHGSDTQKVEAPVVAQGAEGQDGAVAIKDTTGEHNSVEGGEVAPAHMDMAGAGPATVDLSGATVSPVEAKSESAGGQEGLAESEISAPVEASDVGQDTVSAPEAAEETTEDNTEDSSPEPVSPGEFSTAVKVDAVSFNESATINTSPETAVVDNTESQEPNSELGQLEQWQKKDAVDGSGVEVDTSSSAVDTSTPPTSSELPSELVTSEPEVLVNPEKPDDFAAKLEASAADEAAAIDDAISKTLPAINGMSSEMSSDPAQAEVKADTAEEKIESPGQTDSIEADGNKSEVVPTVEDTPFPELKPDVESEVVKIDSATELKEAVGSPVAEADSDNKEIEPPVAGGADVSDVRINQAEYVTPENSENLVEKAVNETAEVTSENTGDIIQLSAEQRRRLEDAERVIQDILKKAA